MKVSLLLLLSMLTVSGCQKSKSHAVQGNIAGTVIDGQTGLALTGATLYPLDEPTHSASSDGTGNYLINLLLAYPHTFRADLAGYNSQEMQVTVPKEITKEGVNFVLLPTAYAAGKIVIVLTWGATPLDLDSHLFVPDGAPTYEVNYAALGDTTLTADPFASLDVDDTDANGPETTTIKLTGPNPYYPGAYRFFVHNYSQDALLTDSGAEVRIYTNGVLTKTYSIPTTGTGIYWEVFDLQGTTFTDINILTDTLPTAPP